MLSELLAGKTKNDAPALEHFARAAIGILRPLLRSHKRRIIHVHTINLVPVALLIKRRYKCKVVSHIHCSPWAYKLDRDYAQYLAVGKKIREGGHAHRRRHSFRLWRERGVHRGGLRRDGLR